MIYKNKNFIFIAFQIIISSFDYFNNNKKFAIMTFLLYYYKNHFFKKNYSILLS